MFFLMVCIFVCFQKIQLPPVLTGGIKLQYYEMALAKIVFLLAKANLIFIPFPSS